MKKTLAAATVAALVGVAGAANAADLYSPSGGLKDTGPYVPPPVWTGFYIGAHGGGVWTNNNKFRDTDGYLYGNGFPGTPFAGFPGYNYKNNESGGFGGGTVGYNWQAGNWGIGTGSVVVGFEADFGGEGINNKFNNGNGVYAPGILPYLWAKDNGDFYADVTGRLGYAWGPTLIYAKGGWGYLDSNFKLGGNYFWGPGSVAWTSNNNNNGLSGWVVGGGIEYLFTPSWSVKAEYLYFDFGKNHFDGLVETAAGVYDDFRFDRELSANTFKVGINYHINSFYTPLK